MIKIRTAQESDKKPILELLVELGRPKPCNKSETMRFGKLITSYINDKDKKLLVACQDSKIIGLVSILFLTRLNRTQEELYVPELIVSTEHQNKGAGRKLIGHCIKIAKRRKCFRIRLESGYPRKGSHQFYKRIGFEDYALTFRKKLG